MKPYMLIQGSMKNIGDFEDKVSSALEEGYDFSGDLITEKISSTGDASELILLQPMILEEEISFDAEDFEDLEKEAL